MRRRTPSPVRCAAVCVLLAACSSGRAPTVSTTRPETSAPPTTSAAGARVPADVIFVGGHVLTMDPARPRADAIALTGERVVAVGSQADVLAWRGDSTRVVDLGGRTLLPGFVDAHSHLLGDAVRPEADPLALQQQAIDTGITTTAVMGADQPTLDRLLELSRTGQLTMRVNLYLLATTNCGDLLDDWWKAYHPDQLLGPNLWVRGVKIFADGGSCKAPAISYPYADGSHGDLFLTQDQLDALVADAHANGFQVAIHALGDRAVEQAQNAISASLAGAPDTFHDRIEHNGVLRADLLPRYHEIGIVPVIFGQYPTCIRTTSVSKFKYLLPVQYGQWEWPWRALLDANPGLEIAWHADYPVFSSQAPLDHLWGFVTREQVDTDGSICRPPDWLKTGEITVDEALPIMTRGSAYALLMEDRIGMLQPGMLADYVVLSGDPREVPAESIHDIQVLVTAIGGQVRHCATGADALCASTRPGAPTGLTTIADASGFLPGSPPRAALDGDPSTVWSAGTGPEQWIQLDLGRPSALAGLRLTVSQTPDGATTHEIWAGPDTDHLVRVHTFSGVTHDGDVLTFTAPSPLAGVRVVRIVTTASPSWVAWREIAVDAGPG